MQFQFNDTQHHDSRSYDYDDNWVHTVELKNKTEPGRDRIAANQKASSIHDFPLSKKKHVKQFKALFHKRKEDILYQLNIKTHQLFKLLNSATDIFLCYFF